jgi:asparagine synthase (glutamine-hydrolysing)
VIPHLPDLYDEPFGDSSQIPTHLVCKAARAHVTVALSGDAGDELFGGYNRYIWGERIWRHVGWVPFGLRRALGTTVSRIPPGVWDGIAKKVRFTSRLQRVGDKAHKLANRLRTVKGGDDLYRSLVTEWPAHASPVLRASALPTVLDDSMTVAGIAEPEQRMMLLDALSYLPDDILTKVDRAAMGVSLETRAPFLDHRVFEMAWRLPLDMKIRSGQSKWALRQILYKHVPRTLIERPKAGFAIPVGDWLRGPLRAWAEDLLAPTRLEQQGYLDAVVIRRLWAQHLSRQHDWTARLWCILMFQAWLEKSS